MRRIFPAVYFVNTYLPKESVKVLLPEKKLPDDSSNIIKKSNIDCHIERRSATFCHGKYK